MKQTVTIKHVNALKSCKAKFSDMGDLSHELTFDCLLDFGDLERLLIMFKQRIPVYIEITSPQSRMDLKVSIIQDREEPASTVVDETTLAELKGNAR